MGQQKPREKPNKPKKTKKNNPEWTYPRFFSQDCFFCFFGFFGFPRVFGQLGLGQQKPREKPNKPKKTILNGLTQDSSHRIVFFVFFCLFGFSRGFCPKPREKPNKPKKTILNGLTQDSSHRIVFLFFLFFWFSSSFWTVGLGTAKTSCFWTVGLGTTKNPNKNKKIHKNNPEWTCPRFFSQD